MNFAALHDLPVIFICENNGLAVHTKIEARQSYDLGEHAAGYGLAVTRTPEGWDFGCIDESFSAIVDEVRQSRRPQFVEIATYRYKEHVGPGEDFDAGYRSRDDFEAWLARDPLHQDQALVERFRPLITAEIDDAVAFAEAAPFTNPWNLPHQGGGKKSKGHSPFQLPPPWWGRVGMGGDSGYRRLLFNSFTGSFAGMTTSIGDSAKFWDQ